MSTNRNGQCFVRSALGMAVLLSLGAHAAGTQAANYFPSTAPDTARITGTIDNTKLVTVGGKPSLAVSTSDAGALPSTQTIHN